MTTSTDRDRALALLGRIGDGIAYENDIEIIAQALATRYAEGVADERERAAKIARTFEFEHGAKVSRSERVVCDGIAAAIRHADAREG